MDAGSAIASLGGSANPNGNNVLRFDSDNGIGTGDFSNVININLAQNGVNKWFFVLETFGMANLDCHFLVQGNGNQQMLLGLQGASFIGQWYITGSGHPVHTTTNIDGTWNMLSVEWNEAFGQGTTSTWLNGNPQNVATNISLVTGGPRSMRMNKYQGKGNCDWGEIIFLENPTQLESDKVEGYLAHKWNLVHALPSNHPYKNSTPT
jgi:hypothetical protein